MDVLTLLLMTVPKGATSFTAAFLGKASGGYLVKSKLANDKAAKIERGDCWREAFKNLLLT